MGGSLDSKILQLSNVPLFHAYDQAKVVLGYQQADSLAIGGEISGLQDLMSRLAPQLTLANDRYLLMPNDTQHRFLEMYEGNPASYLDRLIQLNQNIVDEINTINSDSTSSHAISITNEVKEIYAQVEELYKLASLMCHHISLIPVPQQPSRWNKFLHIFQRTSEQQMFTVKEQEYFLQRYKCNTQVNVTSDAMNSLFDGFENKIVFSGIIFVDKKRKKWKYEITHTADLSSKNTVTCLEVGDYFDFHFRDNFDHKDGSHYWSVRIGENETDSFSSNHYNNDYYNTAMQQLAQIKAQIQANLPGALEIALIYPIPGTLSIELALK